MSCFTYSQDNALKEILTTIVEKNQDPVLTALVNEHNLIEAVSKDAHTESVVGDVEGNAENNGFELTRDQALDVAYKVIDKYDESDYQAFITNEIQNYLHNHTS